MINIWHPFLKIIHFNIVVLNFFLLNYPFFSLNNVKTITHTKKNPESGVSIMMAPNWILGLPTSNYILFITSITCPNIPTLKGPALMAFALFWIPCHLTESGLQRGRISLVNVYVVILCWLKDGYIEAGKGLTRICCPCKKNNINIYPLFHFKEFHH